MTSRLLRVKLHYNSKIFNCSKEEHLSYWNKQQVLGLLDYLIRLSHTSDDCRTKVASLFLLQHYGITEDQRHKAAIPK